MASPKHPTATAAHDLTPVKVALLAGAAVCALAFALWVTPANADDNEANESKDQAEGMRDMHKDHMGDMQEMRKEHADDMKAHKGKSDEMKKKGQYKDMKDGKKHMDDDHMDGAKKAEKKMKKMKGHGHSHD